MKINKIYISAFGGLKDYTLDLNDSMNIIFGENENGKSTVMAFIKAMFYGTGKKTQSLSSSIRTKYTPFDGSPMGGRIHFEYSGTRYSLERQFNKSDSTDKITLVNLDTGESVPETNDVGIRFFGIGAEAFGRSMFIGAERNYDANDVASGELNSRLSNLAVTGDDNISYQKIENNILSEKEKIISKSGRTGTYVKGKALLDNLEEKLKSAEQDAERKLLITDKIKELTENYGVAAKRYRAIKRLTDSKEDIKNAEKLKEFLELKKQLTEINNGLTMPNGKILDSAYFGKLKFCYSKINPQKELCERTANEIEDMKKALSLSETLSTEETEEKIEEAKNKIDVSNAEKAELKEKTEYLEKEIETLKNELTDAENAKKPLNLPLLIIGTLLMAFAIVIGVFIDKMYFISAIAGLVIFVLAFVFKPKDISKTVEISDELERIKEDLSDANSRTAVVCGRLEAEAGKLKLLESVLNTDRTVKERKAAEISEKEQVLNAQKEKLSELNGELDKILDGYNFNPDNCDELEKKVEEQKNIKLKLTYLSKDLGNISYEEAEKKLNLYQNNSDYKNIDFDAAEKEKENLTEKIDQLKQNITALETELKTAFRNSEQPEVLKKDISEIKTELQHQKDYADCADIALEVLAESFAGIRRGYGKTLEDKTLGNFSRLTGGRYGGVTVSKSMDLSVEQKDVFGMREIGYLSTGTEDQAYLSLRLAICELISDKENYPVMLDDVLCNYDDKRTEEALKFLKEYSQKQQVVLFTCHNSICDTANRLDIETKNLR